MFASVLLSESRQKIVIPMKWILSVDIVQVFNYGVSHTKDHIIYYSQNLDDEPNFRLKVEDVFEFKEGCYEARILHAHGK